MGELAAARLLSPGLHQEVLEPTALWPEMQTAERVIAGTRRFTWVYGLQGRVLAPTSRWTRYSSSLRAGVQ